jgi:hypothetical protein
MREVICWALKAAMMRYLKAVALTSVVPAPAAAVIAALSHPGSQYAKPSGIG